MRAGLPGSTIASLSKRWPEGSVEKGAGNFTAIGQWGHWRPSISTAAVSLALTLILAMSAVAQTPRVRILQPVNSHRLVTLHGNTPPLARREFDRGPAPDDLSLNRMLLVLKRSPEQEVALRKLLIDQQVKSSPEYHHWLTPEQFGTEFGPAEEDIQTISAWLMDQGFEIDRVATGRSVIEFSGTAGLVREAFHTAIHRYAIHGKSYLSNDRDPQIPEALAPIVAGIASLNNFPVHRMSRQIGLPIRLQRSSGPAPLYTFTGTDGKTYHPLSPADFAKIYDVPPSFDGAGDGSGEAIAIVSDSNINTQDDINFRSLFAEAGASANVILNGPDPGVIPGPEGEAILDVEWAGAFLPGAGIDLVVSEDTDTTPGINLSALFIVDHNLAPVMSVSYGQCESQLGVAGNAFFNSIWEEAAAQGISVIVAAGDLGPAACDAGINETEVKLGLSVSGFASTPFNVAVGGTDFDDSANPSLYWSPTNNPNNQSSALSYIPETTWNDSCAQAGSATSCSSSTPAPELLAGGGGPSNCGILTGTDPNATCAAGYAKPAWQSGPGVPNDSARDIPDVSLFSATGRNGSFYIVCQADASPVPGPGCNLTTGAGVVTAGGTSVAAQTFAAIMALIDQKTGQRQGNPNYVLYKLAAQPGASCASNASAVSNSGCVFYDIVTGNNSLPCASGTPDCQLAGPNNSYVVAAPGSNPPVPAWNTTPGYDLATGLGSVNVTNLLNKWNSVSFTPTTTQLNLSPTTLASHGQPVSVNITVSGPAGQPGTPTGSVVLIAQPDGTLASATNVGQGEYVARFDLLNGAANGLTTALPGGNYSVVAHYAGDGNFGGSDSNTVEVTVGKETSSTTLGIDTYSATGTPIHNNPASLVYGSPYVLEVSVADAAGNLCSQNQIPPAGCPSGTVKLTDNGAPLDVASDSLNSLGLMQDNLIQLSPGPHSIVAAYLGDNSFNPSTSNPYAVSVTQASTTTTITSSAATVQGGSSVTLTATVNTQSNGAAPTGTVQFMNGSTPIAGTVSYTPTPFSGTAYAKLTASLNAVFSSTAAISADYSGDTNYSGSNSPGITVTVTPGFGMSVNPSTVTISAPGQSGSTTATVTAGGGFSGAVLLSCQIPASMTETTCSFSPATITTGPSATSGQSKLTITTTAPQTSAGLFGFSGGPQRWLGGALLALLMVLLLLGIFSRRRRLRLAFAFCLLLAIATAGCGGGGGGQSSAPAPAPPDPGTAAGTYVITLTATSGTIAHTVLLTVSVQ